MRIVRLEPINGFAAEVSASLVIFGASLLGYPVSTTRVGPESIFGVGIAKRAAVAGWTAAPRRAAPWNITLPGVAVAAWLMLTGLRLGGLRAVALSLR